MFKNSQFILSGTSEFDSFDKKTVNSTEIIRNNIFLLVDEFSRKQRNLIKLLNFKLVEIFHKFP